MNTKALFGLALLAAPCLVSCSVEDQELPAEELYTRQFYKEFGLVDKNQDWNVVEQKSLTFDVANPTHVKIYELQGDEYRLAADYENVTNGQTITFDGMEGDDELFLVSLDGKMVSAKNGQTVTMKSSVGGILKSSAVPDDYRSYVENTEATDISLVGDDDALKHLSLDGEKGKDNVNYLTKDNYFVQVSNDPYYTYYPVYWNSKKKHTVGIFYTDADGNQVEFPVYKDHEGDELSFYFKPNESTSGTAGYQTVTADNCVSLDGYTVDTTQPVQSKGYKVKLGAGIVYGMYVEVDDKKYYSAAQMNKDGKSYFAYHMYRKTDTNTGQTTTRTYLMFDDPETVDGNGDGDYNDLVFYIPEELKPISDQSVGWTVACEDLGGTFDFDFNDLVFRVYHTSGYNFATVQPLAAGGTLPAYLSLKTLDGTAKATKEWHQYFGNGYDSGTMINTYNLTEKDNNWVITIKGVGTNWSMSNFASTLSEAGGFTIDVTQADGTKTSIIGPTPNSDTPSMPQILVLPLKWAWPKELQHISDKAYTGNGTIPSFRDWAKDKNKTSWVDYNNGNVLYYDGLHYSKDKTDVITVTK